MQTIANIKYHKRVVLESHNDGRQELNQFLKSNYDNFFKEKLQDFNSKSSRA